MEKFCVLFLTVVGAFFKTCVISKIEIDRLSYVEKLRNKKKTTEYITENKIKTFFGLCFIIFSTINILYPFSINEEIELADSITNFVLLIVNILIGITGLGLVILDESERKDEDDESINVFIGKQLFEKGLNGIVVGVLIGSLTFVFSMLNK